MLRTRNRHINPKSNLYTCYRDNKSPGESLPIPDSFSFSIHSKPPDNSDKNLRIRQVISRHFADNLSTDTSPPEHTPAFFKKAHNRLTLKKLIFLKKLFPIQTSAQKRIIPKKLYGHDLLMIHSQNNPNLFPIFREMLLSLSQVGLKR